MKTKINFLTISVVALMIILSLFSCAKEELLPVAASAPESPEAFAFAENQLQALIITDGTTTAEKVAIRGFDCSDKGQWLLAYNPNSSDLNYFNSRDFTVRWYINGCPAGDSNRLDCTCRGRYYAMVLHNATQQLVGIAFYAIEEECPISDDGTNA